MDPARRIVRDGGLLVRGSRIEAVLRQEDLPAVPAGTAVIDLGPATVIPGFIQTHLHLCQTLFRGLADGLQLLDWLRLRIFPYEAAHTGASMYASARSGIAELLRSGTTTVLDMGSIHHEEEIVRAVEETGIRAFVGKALMDRNDAFPPLRESASAAMASAREQARRWHGAAGGRIRYAVAPRFILSCSDDLLREAGALAAEHPGMLFHTHAAENRHEMDAVRSRCGMDNIEYFAAIDLLHERTCLAHCIWLSDREQGLLAERRAAVLHCPSSNLMLASGIAPVPALLARGVTVSLGADGAPCNNTLDMFKEMRLAALIQKPEHGPGAMPARTVLELATLGGARALGIAGETGSLEPGKAADLAVLDLDRVWNNPRISGDDDIYSAVVHTGSPENVVDVMVDGVWVYRRKRHTTLDENEVAAEARSALRELLHRMDAA
jgi:cytosine/adenosine deaminase-related metal-dependent hydrolase